MAYREEDLLKGLELQEFCARPVVESMMSDGYIFNDIKLSDSYALVSASRENVNHMVLVEGDVFPFIAKGSCLQKKRFSDYCKAQGYVPLFASVSLVSQNGNGIALKNDGFFIRYKGNENLTDYSYPNPGEEEYRAYCMEVLLESYKTGDFSHFITMLADDVEYSSFWVFETMKGKDKLSAYYNAKGKALKNTEIHGLAMLAYFGNGNLEKLAKLGGPAALIAQKYGDKVNRAIILPTFNDKDEIVKLDMTDPSFCTMRPYYV